MESSANLYFNTSDYENLRDHLTDAMSQFIEDAGIDPDAMEVDSMSFSYGEMDVDLRNRSDSDE